MEYYFAPMEGVTGAEYRAVHHRHFPGVDRYYMPFITPTQDRVFTPRELRNIAPERNVGYCAVPQLLTKNAGDFNWAAGELWAMGYDEVNLNLGCPSGTVTAKGKGAGMLADLEGLDRFLDGIFSAARGKISVKTRLGLRDPEEIFPLLERFARYPISLLILHPRVRQDFYKEPVRPDYFARALEVYPGPMCYNGGLRTLEDWRRHAGALPSGPALDAGAGTAGRPGPDPPLPGWASPHPAGAAGLSRRALPHLSGCVQKPAEHRVPHEGAVELSLRPVRPAGKAPQAHPQGGRLPRL